MCVGPDSQFSRDIAKERQLRQCVGVSRLLARLAGGDCEGVLDTLLFFLPSAVTSRSPVRDTLGQFVESYEGTVERIAQRL